MLRSTLGAVLRSWRKRKPGLNQIGLSRQAGLPANAVGDLERGERKISAEELVSLCAALEISVAAFLEDVKIAQIRALRPLEETLQGVKDGGQVELSTLESEKREEGQAKLFFFGLGLSRAGDDPEGLIQAMTKLFRITGSPEDSEAGR